MNYLLYVSSEVLFSKTSHFITKTSLYGYYSSSWRRSVHRVGIKAINLDFVFTRFPAQCYSTRPGGRRAPRSPKLDTGSCVEEEKDAFYVVRKGDIIGVYSSLSDCQDQVGFSVCDPSVSVFKGNSLPREAEEYLVSRGLKKATYSITALDVKEDLFGKLVPCPFQQPSSSKAKTAKKDSSEIRSEEVLESDGNGLSCILEFDGASKGNPGQAGAGVVLRAEDGNVIFRLREGLGIATNNVAEYRAMILGMKYALEKGFKQVHVQGDSKLVCMQIQGLWKTKKESLSDLCKEAKELKDKFLSFEISHVLRALNSEADVQANLATNLQDGEVQEECIKK